MRSGTQKPGKADRVGFSIEDGKKSAFSSLTASLLTRKGLDEKMANFKKSTVKRLCLKLKEELGVKNVNEVPRITKITLNMGVGEAIGDKKVIEHAVADLEKIAGQKASCNQSS